MNIEKEIEDRSMVFEDSTEGIGLLIIPEEDEELIFVYIGDDILVATIIEEDESIQIIGLLSEYTYYLDLFMQAMTEDSEVRDLVFGLFNYYEKEFPYMKEYELRLKSGNN
ncbi:hypothetical protein EI74_0665 [Mycoplasma testudineum]|uniref:Uncharacterized protein n=1 Tax=Mycoplasma testudineum TaxID=244584 RepID=A0A4R6ICN1_9MOLU|nr:hypothetical protein [Mycoplasma testudineum]OYD26565.1 hypothetical protein CG473_02915 [Mycoplasma testudineum]TDO19396.1 hypothetical protein EI74_0665 [Mycoplasma testudineum]